MLMKKFAIILCLLLSSVCFANMQILIKTPFWKTTYAFIIYFAFILSVLLIAYRIMHNFERLNNKNKTVEQLTDYKLAFFNNISNEFLAPLTLIQGALEKMEQKSEKLSEEMLSSLHIMDVNTQRLLRFINQLLEFCKRQNNKPALSLEETDVIAFINEFFTGFKDIAQSKNMDYRFITSTDNFKMFIDREQEASTNIQKDLSTIPLPEGKSDKDKEFTEKLNVVLENNLGNYDFSVNDFARQMKVGRTVFYKKVKDLTGYSPNEYIRILRMKKAAELLQKGDLTVSEVSYKVGINDPFYFSKCFKSQFGVAPSMYKSS